MTSASKRPKRVVGLTMVICALAAVVIAGLATYVIMNSPAPLSISLAPGQSVGPSFNELEWALQGSQTSAQAARYWESVRGTRVRWSGGVFDADDRNNTATLLLKCNPQSMTFDVEVELEPNERTKIPSTLKGQQIAVEGTLDRSSTYLFSVVYTLTDARIVE